MSYASPAQTRKIATASIMGNLLEFYDFTLFGFLAPVIARLFFPTDNPITSLWLSFSAFALGFMTRPLGGILFGHIGDKYGRKVALSYSILLISIPTAMIGLMPTYETIGLWAPISIVLLRLCQGLCAGGEYNGAALFLLEHTDPKRRGFLSGVVTTGGVAGGLTGSAVAAFVTNDMLPDYFWRFAFLIGLVAGIVGFYIRRNLPETPEFKAAAKQVKKTTVPFLEVFKHSKWGVFSVIGVASVCGGVYYTQISFINAYFSQVLGMNLSHVLGLITPVLFLNILLLIVLGKTSDRVGSHKQMMWSALGLMVVAYPIFVLLNQATYLSVILAHLVMVTFTAGFVAPSHAVMMACFKPEYRYSGVAISFSIGMTAFGGTSPVLFLYLINKTGWVYAPVPFLMFYALFGFVGVWQAKRKLQK